MTISCRDMFPYLGSIVSGQIQLNDKADIIQKEWDLLPKKYKHVRLDEFVIMPNHVHGIIVFGDQDRNAKYSLGQVVAYFKYQTTKRINALGGTAGCSFWQRGYYDRVIRNTEEWQGVKKYIRENPEKIFPLSVKREVL